MTAITYLDASRLALAEEMRRDPRVWALGEDLGRGVPAPPRHRGP